MEAIDEQLVRQRTNALRAHLAEFGMVAAHGLRNVSHAVVRDDGDRRLPDVARQVLQLLANQIDQIEAAVTALERQLLARHKTNPVSQRLASIPGIGPIIVAAIARRLRTQSCSARTESSPPGWAWCRQNSSWAASPSAMERAPICCDGRRPRPIRE
jgi:transposase